MRDFIHIDDVVSATMKAVELEILKPINLGSGIPTSFIELAETVFDVSGTRPSDGIKLLLEKPVGVHFRCSDPTLMHKFYTSISLREGIERSLSMHCDK